MKITGIETVSVGAKTPGNGRLTDRNFIFVLVRTDEGLTGLGEATLEGHDQSVKGAIADLEPLLLGEDPLRINYLAQVMMRQTFWHGGVIKGSAVAGIELALWDILGKSVQRPVHQLIGGRCRESVRCYLNGWSKGAVDPDEIGDRAAEALETGHRAFKYSLAVPSWPVRDDELLRHVSKSLTRVRDAIGPEALLMFDGHGRYDTDQAQAIARILADYNVFFFEEPVQPTRVQDTAKVARDSPLPIAVGERLSRKEEFAAFLHLEAMSVAQPDLAHCHGLGEGLKIASLADTSGVWVAPHGPMSPVLTTVSLHFDAAIPNFLIQEILNMDSWCEALITNPLQLKDGYVSIPDGPGWGIELNEDLCRARPQLQITIPRLFRADGSVSDW